MAHLVGANGFRGELIRVTTASRRIYSSSAAATKRPGISQNGTSVDAEDVISGNIWGWNDIQSRNWLKSICLYLINLYKYNIK